MITSITHITPNINNQEWEIDKESGHQFEDYIYKVVVKSLNATFSKDINVQQTEATRDGGKDIIIDTTRDLNLFGVFLSLKGKNRMRIYIECKSSTYDTIPYDKFAKNISIAGQDHVDYLLLITNKTITPYSYYYACETAIDLGYDFILIDQYLLANYLQANRLNKWNYVEPSFDTSNISICFQVSKGSFYRKPNFELFVLCRNYSENMAECEVELRTDRNWRLSDDKLQFVLDTKKGRCIKLVVSREYFDGLDDILLQFSFNNNLNLIQLDGNSLSYDFELPFTGANHNYIIGKVEEKMGKATSFTWVNLYGEAGIGKTRIIDELSKNLWQRNVRTCFFTCENSKKQSTFDSLLNCVQKTLHKNVDSNTLKELLYEINDELLWTVLVVEDIHNSDTHFLKMLQEMLREPCFDINVLFITAGRDDYTVYNETYFSFLEMLNILELSYMLNYQVKPLEDEECKNLIKRIIDDIPAMALERIHKASNNNPFFLIQFIEYLLEIKLVNLLTRDTVGIPNVHTFSEKIYIPKSIEDILEKRYCSIKNFSSGDKLQNFIIAASLYGIQFPKKLLLLYFSESEYEDIQVLFQKHFLKYVDEETIQFDHESLYLYIKNLKVSRNTDIELNQYIYSNQEIFKIYPTLKQGIILYKIKKYAEAADKFKIPMQEISAMDNVSSENISEQYYEYFSYIYIYEIAKKEKKKKFMQKVIQAKVYVAMHNLAIGQAKRTFEEAFKLIKQNHSNDEVLYLEIKQLQASFFLHIGMISKARGIMLELLSVERTSSDKFDDDIRFNLFERAASLYIHSNHIKPAIEYNKLAYEIADKMNNDKLRALTKINEAKLWFFSDCMKSYECMKEARMYLSKKSVPRINCHNELGMLTAEMVLSECDISNIKTYINRAQKLLNESININYPLDVIRSHFLLAVLHYFEKDHELCKKQIEAGIDASIRYGILKLMGNYYNLKALVAIKEKQNKEYITSLFDTMIDYLKQEDLLFLGNLDFTYSNIILLTNYLIFLNENELESKNYQFLSQISYYGSDVKCDYNCSEHIKCHYTCFHDTKIFKENFKKIKEGSLLLVNPQYKFMLKDDMYFIPIYL